jgi:rhodanese-related sulfurtransferase
MRSLIFLMLIMTTEFPFPQENSDYKCITLNKDDFYSDMKLNPQIKVIDVRSKSEFMNERIENAINIPLSRLPCKRAKEISRETVIYLYCKVGVRSCSAAAKFNDMGFRHIYVLDGGLNAWKKAGLPLITGPKGLPEEQFIPLSPYPALAPEIHIR